MELHPTFQQPALFDFCLSHGIQPVGYSPLGRPSRPGARPHPLRMSSTWSSGDPAHRGRARLASRPRCLKWAVQRGQIPIPFSVKPPSWPPNLAVPEQRAAERDDMAEIAKAVTAVAA
jgi:diketogulonate reductase-like aldo/keto reductase